MREGPTWTKLNGAGVEDEPNDGVGEAAVSLDAVDALAAGSYRFAIIPYGGNPLTVNDYNGYCELAVTAYTGQGANTDVVIDSEGLTTEGAHAES